MGLDHIHDQEPSLYLNGSPVCARPANKIGEYAELGNVTADQLDKDEEEFLAEVDIFIMDIIVTNIFLEIQVKSRAESNGGKVKYLDVHKAELEVRLLQNFFNNDLLQPQLRLK